MRARLAKSGGRFSALVETIVTSRQFLHKRSVGKVIAQATDVHPSGARAELE